MSVPLSALFCLGFWAVLGTASGIKIRDEWETPNLANRASSRINLDAALSPKMDLGVRAGFTQELIRLPQNDNNITGLYGNSLLVIQMFPGVMLAILLLSLSVWGALLGFIGLIIALPLTTLIIAYWQRYVTKEHEKSVEC